MVMTASQLSVLFATQPTWLNRLAHSNQFSSRFFCSAGQARLPIAKTNVKNVAKRGDRSRPGKTRYGAITYELEAQASGFPFLNHSLARRARNSLA